MMKSLTTYSNQHLAITLQYPQRTPLGYHVNVVEKLSDVSYRIHLISDESSEIYFEVGCYHTLSTIDAMNLFQKELVENINNVEISHGKTTTFAAKPAYPLAIRWTAKERNVIFVEHEGKVYRIIYDPVSPINKQILNTLTFM